MDLVNDIFTMTHLGDGKVRQRTLERIGRIRPDSAAQWGKMSVHQMICHLTDAFKASLGEKPVTMNTGPLQRTVVKWIALYVPLRWPKGVPTMPEIRQGLGGTPPADFERDRKELIEIITRFAGSSGQVLSHPHPFFGQMCDREWFRWGYLHTDHHLRQFGV